MRKCETGQASAKNVIPSDDKPCVKGNDIFNGPSVGEKLLIRVGHLHPSL